MVIKANPSSFDEWQAKHGPNGGAYDIEMQRAGWVAAARACADKCHEIMMRNRHGSRGDEWCDDYRGGKADGAEECRNALHAMARAEMSESELATAPGSHSEPPTQDRRTGPPDRRLAGHGLLWLGFEVERSSAPGRRSTDRYFRQEPQPPADRCT